MDSIFKAEEFHERHTIIFEEKTQGAQEDKEIKRKQEEKTTEDTVLQREEKDKEKGNTDEEEGLMKEQRLKMTTRKWNPKYNIFSKMEKENGILSMNINELNSLSKERKKLHNYENWTQK